MATTVAQHTVATFTSPVNGTTPIDANTVRGNDNTIRSSYNDHDSDPGIHVQSSTLASRPTAGTAGRKWITADAGEYKLWYDDGTRWNEVGNDAVDVSFIADGNIVKGDVLKLTGWNNGQNLPTLGPATVSGDVCFAIATETVTNGDRSFAVNTGFIEDVNTSAFSTGDILYPSNAAGPGTITSWFQSTKPTSGNYQLAAYVIRDNASNGVLFVEFSGPRIVERSDNTANTVVLRDGSGNFSAGTVSVGALTSTGLVTFASLKGTGATTVTNILDEDNMASDSATALATQQSIKAYVDSQVTAQDLDFAGDSGVGAVDLDSQSLTIAGTTNEIVTAASGQTLTIGLPSSITVNVVGNLTGNADTATKLSSSRTFALTGDVTGSVSSDLTSGASISTSIAAGAIVDADINAAAAISLSKLATGALPTGITVASANIVDGTIVNADISASAEIAVSKLADGSARQLLQTDAAGTGVEWTSNVDVPGTLDVTGATTLDSTLTVTGDVSIADKIVHTGDTNTAIRFPAADTISFETSAAEAARIDSSGNVGVGVTPSGWSAFRALQLEGGASFASLPAAKTTDVFNNAYYDGTAYKYIAAAEASYYRQQEGDHQFHTAGSGSAGATISFSERMRIDSSGNVAIGTTSPVRRLDVTGPITGYANLALTDTASGTTGTGGGIVFRSDNGSGTYVSVASIQGIKENATAGNQDGSLIFATKGSLVEAERMRIDSSGRVLVGSTSARNNFYNTSTSASFQSEGSTASTRRLAIISSENSATAPAVLILAQQKSGTIGGNTLSSSGDYIGAVSFLGNDGSEFCETASINSFVDGTAASNSMPGRLVFSTTSSGNVFATERMRITSDGYLRMASGSGGIQFNGDTAAANALDDYEEGTWTPTLPNGGTLTVDSAKYTKIGNQVTVSFYVYSIAPTNNGSDFIIGGLPYAANSGSPYYGGSFGYVGDSNLDDWLPITGNAFTYIYFHVHGATSRRTNSEYITAASGTDDALIMTITYFTS